MHREPTVEYYRERPYIAIGRKVNMKDIPVVLPPLIPHVLNFVGEKNLIQTGPAFFRYLTMDDEDLEVEVGVPVQDFFEGDGEIVGSNFPAGKYATIKYFGDYKYIRDAHEELESWMGKNRLVKKEQIADDGISRGCRIEFYITDPAIETNPDKWETDIVSLVEDDVKPEA